MRRPINNCNIIAKFELIATDVCVYYGFDLHRSSQNSVNLFYKHNCIKKQNPLLLTEGLLGKDPGDDLLSHDKITLPSARLRFTSVFGMGTGGATTL